MSDDNDSKNPIVEITDLVGLSKPATVLVNRVLDGFGAVGKLAISIPQAVVDAKVELIKAKAATEIADIERRAAFRVGREQIREQMNLEAIVAKAVRDELDKNATPEDIDEDWLCQFKDKAKHVSKEEMQGLWAKILAGEAQAPGSFSPMTLQIVSNLTRADAAAFTNLCAFVTYGHRAKGEDPLVFNLDDRIHIDNGVTFADVMQLEFMNLAIYQHGVVVNFPEHESQQLAIYGKDFRMIALLPEGRGSLPDGNVMFTQAGRELCRICETKAVKGFADYIIAEYKKHNIFCYLY